MDKYNKKRNKWEKIKLKRVKRKKGKKNPYGQIK